MSLDFLASFASLIELIGDLIPKRVKVGPYHVGVKFKWMKKVVFLRAGVHWVWPIVSNVEVRYIGRTPLPLVQQFCMTKDGRTVMVDGTVDIEFFRSEHALMRAFVQIEDINILLCAKGMACVCEMISRTDFADLSDRDDFNERLTDSIKDSFRKLGVRTHAATLETLATGRELLHIGSVP